jgi:hypothetical protein
MINKDLIAHLEYLSYDKEEYKAKELRAHGLNTQTSSSYHNFFLHACYLF